MKPIMQQLRLN